MSRTCWRRSCVFKGSRSGPQLPADCVDISFLFCLASSVTKALSGDRPVYWWRGEALPGEGNAGCVGPLGRRGGQRVRWVH